jgi:hypothetical protein
MKKIILSAVLLTSVVFGAKAQKDGELKFNVGAELGLPIGTFSDAVGLGFGASFQGAYGLSNNLFATGSLGYMTFGGKTVSNGVSTLSSEAFSFVPFKVGVKFMASEQVFLQPEIGLAIGTSKGSGTNFMFAIGGGYMLSENLSAGIRYESISATGGSFGSLGGRFAYYF